LVVCNLNVLYDKVQLFLTLMIEISIVVPVRNESENIKPFLQETENVLKKMAKSYEIIFVLDPSTDDTENIILNTTIKKNYKYRNGVKLIIYSNYTL